MIKIKNKFSAMSHQLVTIKKVLTLHICNYNAQEWGGKKKKKNKKLLHTSSLHVEKIKMKNFYSFLIYYQPHINKGI